VGIHAHLGHPEPILACGLFLFGMLHVPPFRNLVFRSVRLGAKGVRAVLVDAPAWLLERSVVRAIADSRPVVFFRRHALTPLLFAAIGVLVAQVDGVDSTNPAVTGICTFVAAVVLCNSRLWRDLREAVADEMGRAWRRLSVDFFPALFHGVMDFFKHVLDRIERVLYAVDEWLRFKEGDRPVSRFVKPVLGLFWGAVTYVVRFCVTVLIEPQINPVKHFPVVTVAHKLLIPLIPTLAGALELTMEKGEAYTAAGVIIFCIPGLFGFLVWELKENWRLYQANRPAGLPTVAIGHHGETMLRLLRPGFHSGTIPRLFTKLRRAERRGKRKASRKLHEGLHEVAVCLRHFVEREFLELLRQSRGWGQVPLSLGAIRLSTSRIQIELGRGGCVAPLCVEFAERADWLVARIAQPGWLDTLDTRQRQTLRNAVAGLYKLAGVSFVAEQLQAVWPPSQFTVTVTATGLLVRSADGDAEAAYELDASPEMQPSVTRGVFATPLPAPPPAQVGVGAVPIPWPDWVEVWERDQEGKAVDAVPLPGIRLLPDEPRP
jgi:hypothetical protein